MQWLFHYLGCEGTEFEAQLCRFVLFLVFVMANTRRGSKQKNDPESVSEDPGPAAFESLKQLILLSESRVQIG